MKELVHHRHLLPVAERYADKVAFYDGAFRATYAEHVERVLRLGDALHGELGLGRGDHFAVTGDAGYLDARGYLYLVDRVKDMIVTGGENVYSVEVENALASHPVVAEVAVIGIPHDIWGEAVHAVVVLKPDAAATGDELEAHTRERIAGFKVPKSVEFRTEPLPLSGALKVLKRELRAPYWEGKERSVH